MEFDFDQPVDRRNTGSDKWDAYAGRDVLPMWVADMDFRAPPAVLEALHDRVDHGVFGYSRPTRELIDITCAMLRVHHHWQVDPDWLVWLPGMVPGLHVACAAVGETDDAVLTTTPVYPPFLKAPERTRRQLQTVALADDAGHMDFDALEAAVTRRTRVFMFCNPHNPTGHVHTPQELERLADFCRAHDLVLVSDEIHCGLVLDPDCQHRSIATLNDDIARRTITLVAPSKTYNIAGLGCSLAIIPDAALRDRFAAARAGFVPGVNSLGYTAAAAAWRDCDDWHAALLGVLRRNRDIVTAAVDRHPRLSMTRPEATYLAWIDCRRLNTDHPGQCFEAAGLGLSDGRPFGAEGYMRLNFGYSLPVLEEAMARLARVAPA